ncbi:hypothetical protein [Deinococcus multiflagellatus]|uniref:DUF4402 domain-containing protein n=1 Tax=Deinococcus multiflagellatus TaxID=1656887 RepID=A0ABW1ZNM9_9DEIO|nr:hypothetical protein [Deinococcus multiflagellatus]MBZ9716021.1 hypothetical protein [Deinococcus multiflagellatus]
MRKIALLALTAALGTAAAAGGTQTTPLKLKVDNVCVTAYSGFDGESRNMTWGSLDLGKINAVSSVTASARVLAVDCNYKTALTVTPPTSITLTSDKGDTFKINNAAWDLGNPLSVQFREDGSFTPNWGYGPYQYYAWTADFKLGGPGSGYGSAWSIPGGSYTGSLDMTFEYNE